MSDESSSTSTAAPPADRTHDDPASAHAAGKASAHEPHGHGGHTPHVAHHFHSLSQQFAVEKLGIWLFLATEILMFGGLFCAYAFYRGLHPEIFLYGHQFLPTHWGAINTAVLLTSSLTMAWAVRAAQINQRGVLKAMLLATFMGGVGFMVIKGIEYQSKFSHGLGPGPGNIFYPVPDTAGEEAHGEKEKAIEHLEHYYDLSPHSVAHGGDQAETHADASHATEDAHEQTAETGGGATDAGEAATASTEQNLVSPDLPAAEQSTVAGPATPASGVNPAFLAGEAAADHKTYTFAQLPEIEQSRMHMFFQIYFLMTGLHGIHVLVGMGLIGWLIVRAFKGAFSPVNFTAVDVVGLYWHLVDLIWIFLFPLLYLIH